MAYNNLYIVDNSTEQQSVKEYLTDWCKVSKQMDIATGYLEIGGLLALDTHWQFRLNGMHMFPSIFCHVLMALN